VWYGTKRIVANFSYRRRRRRRYSICTMRAIEIETERTDEISSSFVVEPINK